MRALFLAVLLAACASAPPAHSPTADAVIAAERAFAARAGEIAWVPAFREFVAPDGQLAQPDGYANAPEQLAQAQDDGNRNLFWWPAFAAISRSGDFGFTTGVVSFDAARTPRGHYFTVWRRQPDGSWKWIYDGGVGPIAHPDFIAPGADVPAAVTATTGEASAERAIDAVRALEETGRARDFMASNSQVFRTGQERATGARIAEAVTPPANDFTYSISRIEASAGGDLVMVLGEARWTSAAGQSVHTLYGRVWQHQQEGWRVLYDQLILPRPTPPG